MIRLGRRRALSLSNVRAGWRGRLGGFDAVGIGQRFRRVDACRYSRQVAGVVADRDSRQVAGVVAAGYSRQIRRVVGEHVGCMNELDRSRDLVAKSARALRTFAVGIRARAQLELARSEGP